MSQWAQSIRKLLGVKTPANFACGAAKRRPSFRMEELEDRVVPATIEVTSLSDGAPVEDGVVTLREAILSANADSAVNADVVPILGTFVTGGLDTIIFAPFMSGAIELNVVGNVTLGASAFLVNSQVVIDGDNGAGGITITRGATAPAMRLFSLTSAGNLTLESLTLSNGLAQGGNGGDNGNGGGGGGAGLGGAIFNNGGTVTINESLLTGNKAQGGRGGTDLNRTNRSGSGGGGLTGNGASGVGLVGGDGGNPSGGLGGAPTGSDGGFGGGGGGGGSTGFGGSGGDGGFGGGGGAGGKGSFTGSSGDGGFGGGGAGGSGFGSGAGGFAAGDGGSGSAIGSAGGGGGGGLGGAVFTNGGTVTITNTTITNNSASGGAATQKGQTGQGLGGGVFNRNGTLSISSSTLTLNNATSEGRDVYLLGDGFGNVATGNIDNTIMGQSGISAVTNFFSNTISTGVTTSAGSGNLISVRPTLPENDFNGVAIAATDPQLGSLANNGGPTKTIAPLTGSPVINAGSFGGFFLTNDQRGEGFTRRVGTIDIGALEVFTGPRITSVTSTTADGSYTVGASINVTVTFSEPLTLAGGTMTLTLDTGATVTFPAFTGQTSVSGTYVVAAGENSTDLDSLSPLELSTGATLVNAATTPARLVISGDRVATLKNIIVDTTNPDIASITSTTADGTYGVGAVISVTVNFTEPTTLTGGTLRVNLDSGGFVTIPAFSGQTSVTGTYTVAAGESSFDLDSTDVELSAGAILKDVAGNVATTLTIPTGKSLANTKEIVIDAVGATVVAVTSDSDDGYFGAGALIPVTLTFSEAVTLDGELVLNLDSGGKVVFSGPVTGFVLTGQYTVAAGQNSQDLDSDLLALSSGSSLEDTSGNAVSLAIPTGKSLADSKAIVIDTIAPTIDISAPSKAAVAGGSVTYTVTYADANFNDSTLTPEDISLITTGTATGTLIVTGSGTTRTVTINNLTGNGTVGIRIPAGTASDLVALQAPGAGPSATVLVDTLAPGIAMSPPSQSEVAGGPVTFTITYTDANFSASTLTASDISMTKIGSVNGTISVSPGTGSTRIVTVSNLTGDGRFSISVAAGTAVDIAGNLAPGVGPSQTVSVANSALVAVGESFGSVRVLNGQTGQTLLTFRPLDVVGGAQYTGLVSVAVGDLSGDGIPDLFVAAANPLGVQGLNLAKSAKVFVYDGATLAKGTAPEPFRVFTPFTTHNGPGAGGTPNNVGMYINGLNIAVGDVNGDGTLDLIAGTRGGSSSAGAVEYGRMVVVSGTSPLASNEFLGAITMPFGPSYEKGVVVAAGDLDGDGSAEVAVTRGGPVAATNPNKTAKLKAYRLNNGALQELILSGNSAAPFAPFAGITSPNGDVLSRDARLAFVDDDGDGKATLVMSILDPYSDPTNQQVRIAAFDVNVSTGKATAVSLGSGPSQSYLVGTQVVNHAISHAQAANGVRSLALLTESNLSGIVYLNPRTGAVLPGGFTLSIISGGVALDGN